MQWTLKIDLGSIENSKYGSALNLKAEIPLLPNSTFEYPDIVKDTERFDRIATELIAKFEKLAGKTKDAKFEKQIRSAICMAACQSSQSDYDECAGLRAMIDVNVMGFVIDDVVDAMIQIQNGTNNYKMFRAFAQNLGREDLDYGKYMNGVIGNTNGSEDAGCLDEFFRLFGMFNACAVELIKHASNPDEIQHLKREWIDCGEAHFFHLAGKLSPAEKFSHISYSRQLSQAVHGMRWTLAQVLLYTPDCYVPEEVRKTLLFRMMMNAHGNGTAFINAIIGMRKDVEEDTPMDTPILHNVIGRGMTLQQAFDDAVNCMKAEISDLHLALEIMGATYGDVEGVDEYLKTVELNFMGTCLSYALAPLMARYPGVSVVATKE